MSKLNRNQLKKLILKEFKMIGMAPMGAISNTPLGMDTEHHHDEHAAAPEVHHTGGHHGGVSKEDCCKAVLCLIECCECPETKQLIQECCEDILSRC
jgi:hypothetical protein